MAKVTLVLSLALTRKSSFSFPCQLEPATLQTFARARRDTRRTGFRPTYQGHHTNVARLKATPQGEGYEFPIVCQV
jgi:hypothetical protein